MSCPPSSANAAEKIAEPTNSQHTMALVFAVRNDESLRIAPTSRVVRPGGGPEAAAAAAAHVVDVAVGHREQEAAEGADRRGFRRRREAEHDRAQHREDQHREREERREQHLEDLEPLPGPQPVDEQRDDATPIANTIQNQVGAGTRSASVAGVAAGAAGFSGGLGLASASAGGGDSSCASSLAAPARPRAPAGRSGRRRLLCAVGCARRLAARLLQPGGRLAVATGAVLAAEHDEKQAADHEHGQQGDDELRPRPCAPAHPRAPPSDAASAGERIAAARGASAWATVGSATRRSLSASGGMSAGLSFASTMTIADVEQRQHEARGRRRRRRAAPPTRRRSRRRRSAAPRAGSGCRGSRPR